MFSMNLQCCQTLPTIDHKCKRLKQISKLKIPYCTGPRVSSQSQIVCILYTSKCDTIVVHVWHICNTCVVFLVYYTCSSYTCNACVHTGMYYMFILYYAYLYYKHNTDVYSKHVLHEQNMCIIHVSTTYVIYMYVVLHM